MGQQKKIHKFPLIGNKGDVPLRPIVLNIDTATYDLAKFLSKFLAPLSESKYTTKNTKTIIDNTKK